MSAVATGSERSLAVQASDTLTRLGSSESDDAQKAATTVRLKAIVATLEKDKDVAPFLKAANISSQDIDREKLRSALIIIRRNAALVNNRDLLRKVNQAIVKVGR